MHTVLQLFQQFWNQHKILRFLIYCLNIFKNNFGGALLALKAIFCKLWSQFHTDRFKIKENLFYKHVLELNFGNHKWVALIKLLKSLHLIAQYPCYMCWRDIRWGNIVKCIIGSQTPCFSLDSASVCMCVCVCAQKRFQRLKRRWSRWSGPVVYLGEGALWAENCKRSYTIWTLLYVQNGQGEGLKP